MRSLWRDGNFLLFWSGRTVSLVGSQITLLALPMAAIIDLDATPFEVSLVITVATAAPLLVALPAGAVVDRVRKRRFMVVSDVLSCLALLSIPLASHSGVLTVVQLALVGFFCASLDIGAESARMSYLRDFLDSGRLVEGNSKIGGATSLARMAGPALGGALVGLIGAATSIAADATSFLFSALTLTFIKHREARPSRPATRPRLRTEISAGLRYVLAHDTLKTLAFAGAISAYLLTGVGAIWTTYLVRELHWSPAGIGVMLAVSCAGGLLGSVVTRRAFAKYGVFRVLLWATLATAIGELPVILVGPGTAGRLAVGAGYFVLMGGLVVSNTAQVSLQQALSPPELLGRTSASYRWLTWGARPVAAAVAGAGTTVFGLWPVLAIHVVLLFVPAAILIASAARSVSFELT
ncbi:MFS transporter [Amycolatopsis sp. NPDC088138]|uniref:MFS transporter n=1 Tax=Amycolatopsis sp. NPDC088138 TaxID=3363938 RepID=UPI0037F657CB